MAPPSPPRAAGVRLPFAGLPPRIVDWVEAELGSQVIHAANQVGGMSPGCATRLLMADDSRSFLKAVGSGLNPRTPELFRHEIAVLSALKQAPYRASLLAAYDDGDWVALLLQDVDGRHPDLSSPDDYVLVHDALRRQALELTPSPYPEAAPFSSNVQKWVGRWQTDLAQDPARYLPPWAAVRFDDLVSRLTSLPDRFLGETLCHLDAREDNLLVRTDGTVVIVDWGMSTTGPIWLDELVLAISLADQDSFDHHVRALPQDAVTDLLIIFGGSQAWRAAQPDQPGLPTMNDYCRDDARRLLAGAERRLLAGNETAHRDQ